MKKFWINHKGLSMSPLLKDGDKILIDQNAIEDLKCGDIILFLDQSSKELTLHRLIDFPLKTKGDLNLCAEMNPLESCLGKAVGYRRNELYKTLPIADSTMSKCYLYLSKLRLKGFFLRKSSRYLLFVVTFIFEFYSEKTKLDHNEEHLLNDL